LKKKKVNNIVPFKIMIQDTYFLRKEVSNSDLTSLKNELSSKDIDGNIEKHYRFGSLLDIVITEPHRVNFYKQTIDDEKFDKIDFKKAEKMKNAVLKDDYFRDFIRNTNDTEFQKIFIKKHKFNYLGILFELDCRCKFDIIKEKIKIGLDLKSTSSKSQKEFEASIQYFDYDRQAAWYMDLAEIDYFVIIGISKENFKVFKAFIKRDSEMYRSGLEKYSYLAFKYNLIYGV